MKFLNNKTILITGGTGSFGKAFVKKLLLSKIKYKKIIIFSRDEFKQYTFQNEIETKYLKKIRFFLGDVRDKERLNSALEGVDVLVHAAALKQVPTAEYNPIEFIKTNIIGAQNIIETSIEKKVSNIIALSTDKASSPINLYGATKLCSDKLFLAANNIKGNRKIKFSVLRYGNVMMSRGSVIPLFLNKKKIIPITNKDMTRFSITLDESINFCIEALRVSKGGEIFVPKLKAYKILDLAKAINKDVKIKVIGTRQGEKINEELISSYDAKHTFESKNFYIIFTNNNYKNKMLKFKKVNENFSYRSDMCKFYSINQLESKIRNEIKKNDTLLKT